MQAIIINKHDIPVVIIYHECRRETINNAIVCFLEEYEEASESGDVCLDTYLEERLKEKGFEFIMSYDFDAFGV